MLHIKSDIVHNAHISTKLVLKAHYITPAHQAHKSFLKSSRLPGDYTAQIKHNNQICPHSITYILPVWREATTVKGLNTRTRVTTRTPEYKSDALNRFAVAVYCTCIFVFQERLLETLVISITSKKIFVYLHALRSRSIR